MSVFVILTFGPSGTKEPMSEFALERKGSVPVRPSVCLSVCLSVCYKPVF